jgi:hypothetical protein
LTPASGHATADDDARPCLGRLSDNGLVLWLQGGVGDLQDVKHAHADVVGEVRQDGGAAQEANLACALEVCERLNGPLMLQNLLGGTEVELEDVQVIGLQPPQALM